MKDGEKIFKKWNGYTISKKQIKTIPISNVMENLFNVNQAAFILKVHPLTIRRYIKEGKLKAIKVAGNIRIKESQLQEFNKELIPRPKPRKSIKENLLVTKVFSINDPLFRLKGLVAHIELTK